MCPRVSVLVPVYKTESTLLRQAIRSVLSQTYRDFELILLEDAPDDSRESVVREFPDPRIRYERNERNLGITPSRNRLIDLARGEYLAIFDHDDICRADRLEKQVAWLDAHPDCGVVSSWTREIPSGRLVRWPTADETIRLELMGGCVVAHTAAMVRASVLKCCGVRYEEAYSPAEDYRLWLRLLPHTRFHVLSEPLVDYRLYAGNTSKTRADKMKRAAILAQEAAYAEMPVLRSDYRRIARQVSVVRFLGVPLFRVETHDNRMCVKLFCLIPVFMVKRSWKSI